MTTLAIDGTYRHAERLIESLVDDGPGTIDEICGRLDWTRGRFASAIKFARDHLCDVIGISIPAPTPNTGWTYEATTDWQPVEAGASYALGNIEARLRSIQRDVRIIKPHLVKGTVEWRRASFLEKHMAHLVGTLGEINGTR